MRALVAARLLAGRADPDCITVRGDACACHAATTGPTLSSGINHTEWTGLAVLCPHQSAGRPDGRVAREIELTPRREDAHSIRIQDDSGSMDDLGR